MEAGPQSVRGVWWLLPCPPGHLSVSSSDLTVWLLFCLSMSSSRRQTDSDLSDIPTHREYRFLFSPNSQRLCTKKGALLRVRTFRCFAVNKILFWNLLETGAVVIFKVYILVV